MLGALLAELGIDLVLPTQLNIAPTESVPVIYSLDGERQLELMHWWLQPAWALAQSGVTSTRYAMFNARCENLQTSKAFSAPFKRRRAIMPASSFIEWQKVQASEQAPKGKQAQLIEFKDRAIGFAALYERATLDGKDFLSCTIITRPAIPEFAAVHERMPVMLTKESAEQWLNPQLELDPGLAGFLDLPGELLVTPIADRINNARNKQAEDLQPLGPATSLH